ncbi:arylsulfatase [Akkermansiaceae bacterium]|nr:arylsulfatase [Akkermansiaceae bacterium]
MRLHSLIPLSFPLLLASALGQGSPPNIVVILCDDLGYGDVRCLNPGRGKIPTPHADRLAGEGMVFTDAHSGSSVCTPTRYGLLTGRYSWRTKLQSGVVTGHAPCLIDKDRQTIAGYLSSKGYDTAIIGKWHLNFQYLDPRTRKPTSGTPVGSLIPDGPLARGFGFFHGFHHAREMKTVVEGDKVIAHDDEVNMLPRLRDQALRFIASRKGGGKPFFLYLPLGSPHTPIVPTDEWKGKSGLGAYGDFVMQTDEVVGAISGALEENGFGENTLVIFSSDNGCSKAADIKGLAAKGHVVSAWMRGSKADIWDGGHRIPFIARWPGKVEPGSQSAATICLTDLFATAADMLGEKPPEKTCEDSVSFLPALLGKPIRSTRKGVVHHSISGHFAYRKGEWKLILARGSGGWSSPKEKEVPRGSPKGQLYHMGKDPAEMDNLFGKHPETVAELLADLEADIRNGRSTAGAESKNDIDDIRLWKSGENRGE